MNRLVLLALVLALAGCATPVCTTIQGATINGTFGGATFHQGNGDMLTVCTAGLTTSARPASAAAP